MSFSSFSLLRRNLVTRRLGDLRVRTARTISGRSFSRLGLEALEVRALMAIDSGAAGAAVFSPLDVDQDGYVSATDALLIVNHLNQTPQAAAAPTGASPAGASPAAASLPETMSPLDVDGDGVVASGDAQLVLNSLDAEAATTKVRIRLQATDLDGNAITKILPGQSFLLKGFVLDQRETGNTGVFAAFADLTWTAGGATVNGAIDHGIYATGPSGTVSANGIDEIGGISGQITPALGPNERVLFSVPMVAGSAGVVHFALDAAETFPTHNTLLFDENGAIPTEQIDYGSIDLAVQTSDPVTASISGPSQAIVEGSSGTTAVEFEITLSAPSTHEITVTYNTQNGTATANQDYTGVTNGTVTFGPGDFKKTVSINVLGDTRDDANSETFSVVLSNPSSDINWSVAEGAGNATATITDDDATPTLSISAPTNVTEGNSGVTSAVFTVTLSAASNQPVTVSYTTQAGTAEAGADFVAKTDTITFAPGETSKTISIDVSGDTKDENDETFSVVLSNPTNATIPQGADTATATILDNDAPPSISISPINVSEPTSGTSEATITVKLNAASGKTVTLNYSTVSNEEDTATAGTDYTVVSGELTFAPGETQKTFVIPILSDEIAEGDETFTVHVESDDPAANDADEVITIGDADAPTVTIEGPATIDEAAGTATYTVKLSHASAAAVAVQVKTTAGSATETADYTKVNQLLVFAPNQVEKTVTVPIISDTLDENNETFTISLGDPTSNVILSTEPTKIAVTTTINDDDENLPTVTIGTPAAVNEGNTNGTVTLSFPVTLSAATGKDVVVHYSTAAGTATVGSDFTSVTDGTITIPAGSTSGNIVISIASDTTFEPNPETFTVTLLNNTTNANLGPTITATGTIIDDDITVSIANPLDFSEAAAANGTLNFVVTLSQTSQQQVTVKFTAGGGTAVSGTDYSASTGTLTFAPGETSKTIQVTVVNDALDEADETFNMTLSDVSGATINPQQGVATAKILDDDPTPTVTIAAQASKAEGNTGTQDLVIPVTLSAASGQTVTVHYSTTGGTALEGTDYTGVPDGTVVFAPGETTKNIIIKLQGDTAIEGNETFQVKLLPSTTNATLGATIESTATIADDDIPLTISSPTVTEGTGSTVTLNFIVTLQQASAVQVTVDYQTGGGTATSGTDYTPAAGTLTFAPGETSKTISVTVAGDTISEAIETLNLTLSNPTNVSLPSNPVAVGTINDDDSLPKISIGTPATISEGNSTKTLNFPVTLSAPSGQAVTVKFSTTAGTATAGSDFTNVTNGTVTIPAGQTTANIQITILGDTIVESNESFTVTISEPTNATLDTTTTATGTIADDDALLTISDASVVEGKTGLTQMVFTVSLSSAQTVDVTVRVNSKDGTALANDDYRLTRNLLVTIPAGQTSATVSIDIGGDAFKEADETFTLELSNPTNATLGAKTIGTGTITNDDEKGVISGFAYIDLNNNGTKDAGEKPLAGVMMKLVRTEGAGTPVELTTLTSADGSYSFGDLDPGIYTVSESQPAGLADGTDVAYTGAKFLTGDSINMTILGETRTDNNFGERGVDPPVITKRMFFANNKTTLPTTPPSFAVTDATATINIANAASATASGTGTPGAHVALVANDGTNTSSGYTTTIGANGTWSITGIDLSKLKDGTITYRMAASDNYGNTVLASRTATKATVAITTATDPITATNEAIVSLSGTVQPGATVTVVASDDAATPHTVSATATVAANGTWTITGFDLSALDDGFIQFVATATDANDNSVSASRRVTKGTQ